MKTKRTNLRWKLVVASAIAFGAIVNRADNPCIEYGPHYAVTACAPTAGVWTEGVLDRTTIHVCVGDTIVAPMFTGYPMFDPGYKSWNVTYDCNPAANHVETAPVYYDYATHIYNPMYGAPTWSTGPFATPGTYSYRVMAVGHSSAAVGWWKGDNNAMDALFFYQDNNGITEGIGYAPGKVGQAFDFNTSSGYVWIPASDYNRNLNVGAANGFTIEAWIKPRDLDQAPIVEWNNDVNAYGVHFYVYSVPGALYANIKDVRGVTHCFSSPGGIVIPNEFQHVALTYDKATGVGRIYWNGLVVAQAVLGTFTPQTTYDLYFGHRFWPDNEEFVFDGLIDEVAIYSCALSDAEISELYHNATLDKANKTDSHCTEGFAQLSTTVTLNVHAQPPAINISPSTVLTHLRGGGPSLIGENSTFGGTVAVGGLLRVAVADGAMLPGDSLAIRNQGSGAGQIGVSGQAVSYGGAPIATFEGGNNSQPLLITFTTAPGSDVVNALLRNLTYEFVLNECIRPLPTQQRFLELSIAERDGTCFGPAASREVALACPEAEVMIVFDKSGSMDDVPNRLANAKAAATTFVQLLDLPNTASQCGLVTFCQSSLSQVNVNLVSGAAGEDTLVTTIGKIKSVYEEPGDIVLCNWTAIGRGVELATGCFGSGAVKAMVVLTDGEENQDTDPIGKAAIAKALGIRVITIGVELTTSEARDTLRAMASSEDDFYDVTDSGTLTEIYEQIAQSLCRGNQPPQARFSRSSMNYAEKSLSVLLDDLFELNDPDSDLNGGSLRVSIAVNYAAPDVLFLSSSADITLNGSDVRYQGVDIGHVEGGTGGTDLVVTFDTPDATAQAAQAVMRAIYYQNISDAPGSLPRTIRVVAADGKGGCSADAGVSGASLPAFLLVNMVAANDPPVVRIGTGNLNYTENGVPVAFSPGPGGKLYDVDTAVLDRGELEVRVLENALPEDHLTVQAQSPLVISGTAPKILKYNGVIIGTFTEGSGITPLLVKFNENAVASSDPDTATPVRSVVKGVSYYNTSDNPSTAVRTVRAVARDGQGGTGESPLPDRTVTVFRVNDKPSIQFLPATMAYTENGVAKVLALASTVADPDSADFDTGTLTVSFADNGLPEDRLGIRHQGTGEGEIGVSGATVLYQNVPIGTFVGGNPGTEALVVTFNAQATVPAVKALVRNLTYMSLSENPPASRSVQAVVQDGDNGTSDPATMTVNITGVNDPPTLGEIDDLELQAGSGPHDVSLTGITSGGEAGQTLTVTASTPDGGIVTLAPVSYTSPDPTGILTVTPKNQAGTAHVTVTVSDGFDQVSREFDIEVKNPVPLVVDAGVDQTLLFPDSANALGTASGGAAPYSFIHWIELSGPASAAEGDQLIPAGAQYDTLGSYTKGVTEGDPYIVIFGQNDNGVINGTSYVASSGEGQQALITAQASVLIFQGNTPSIPVTAQLFARQGAHFAPDPGDPGDPYRRTVGVDQPGTYELQFSVQDGAGQIATDTLIVNVLQNLIPVVDAGPDRQVAPATDVTLVGFASDDGVPSGALTYAWSVVEHPTGDSGTIGTGSALTTSFRASTPGLYKLRLTATEAGPGQSGYDDVAVVVFSGLSRTYTRNFDFAEGLLVNVNYDTVKDELWLNDNTAAFPYLNVPYSGRGTVGRIEANTGEIIGEYLTGPAPFGMDVSCGSPSRTTVDRYGNVWVANRMPTGIGTYLPGIPIDSEMGLGLADGKGSIARMGIVIGGTRGNKVNGGFVPDPNGQFLAPPFKYNTCVDRDGDGLIKTSYGNRNVLSWPVRHVGKIFVSHSSAVLSDGLFGGGTAEFATKLASWFSDKKLASFLVYSADSALNGGLLRAAMEGAGHSWKVDTTMPFTLDNLRKFDAVFLSSTTVNAAVLKQYVLSGGCVFIGGGTGDAVADANRWNPFLNEFGLEFLGSYNSLSGPYQSYFENTTLGNPTLQHQPGNFIQMRSGTGSRNRNLYSAGGTQAFAAYQIKHVVSGHGRIVVNKSAATLTDANWSSDTEYFVISLVEFLTQQDGGANVLICSDHPGLNGANFLERTRTYFRGPPEPYVNTVDVSTAPITFQGLLKYHAVYLAGTPADTSVLIDYVKAGGSVYLAAGALANPATEAGQWNPFLSAFGLELASTYTGDSGWVELSCGTSYYGFPACVPVDHFLLPVEDYYYTPTLYFGSGNIVRKLTTESHSRILVFQTEVNIPNEIGDGRLAIYSRTEGVDTAEDEAIINCTRVVPSMFTRSVAVDTNNNVWVGSSGGNPVTAANEVGPFTQYQQLIDGVTGLPIGNTAFLMSDPGGNTLGGYGSVVDRKNYLWSSAGVAFFNPYERFNFSTFPPQVIDYSKRGQSLTASAYGITVDPRTDHIWTLGSTMTVNKVLGVPPYTVITATAHQSGAGLVVSQTGDIWCGHQLSSVGHYYNTGTTIHWIGDLPTGCDSGIKGVAIDSNGKVWAISKDGGKALRINPNAGPIVVRDGVKHYVGEIELTVELGSDAGPYTYSDMSGYVMVGATMPSGMWSVTCDAGSSITWQKAVWTRTNNTSGITVEVRAAQSEAGLAAVPFIKLSGAQIDAGVDVPEGKRYTGTLPAGITGRFIEIRLVLTRGANGDMPVLKDFTISEANPVVSENNRYIADDDHARVLRNSVENMIDVLANDTPLPGTSLQITKVSAPAMGRVEVIGGTQLRYTPNANIYGADRFVYTVADNQGTTERALVYVNIAGVGPQTPPPVANNDIASVRMDTHRNVLDVLANDTDPTGSSLRIVDFTPAMHGNVDTNACGNGLEYTPATGFTGIETIFYTIENRFHVRATASVTITVQPDREIECDMIVAGEFSNNGHQWVYITPGLSMPVGNHLADRYSFTASAGQTITITMVGLEGCLPAIYMFDPQGQEMIQYRTLDDGDRTIQINAYLPQAGVYKIRPMDMNLMSFYDDDPPTVYALTVQCGSAARMGVYLTFLGQPEFKIDTGGTVSMGDSGFDLRIKNEGTANLLLPSPTLTGHFTRSVSWQSTLTPEQEMTVHISPQTSFLGEQLGSFSFTGSGQPFSIDLYAFNSANVASPTIRLTAPVNGTVLTTPANLVLRAEAEPGDESVTITRVDFFVETATGFDLLGSAASAPYTYTWNNLPEGKLTIKALAVQSDGGSAWHSLQIFVEPPIDNYDPIAVQDQVTFKGNSSGNKIHALNNDSDPDGDTISVLSYTQPRHGVVHLEGTYFLYTPEPYGYGPDSFSYTVHDGKGGTARTSVRITVVNLDPPTVSLTSPENDDSVPWDGTLTFQATATDADGSVTKVEFYADGEKVGTDSASPFSFVWDELLTGDYTLQAIAYDDDGLTTLSESVLVHVTGPPNNHPPAAQIQNLPMQALHDGSTRNTVVTEGVFALKGMADDAQDPTQAVRYRTEIYSPEGELLQTSPWTEGRVPGTTGNDELSSLDFGLLPNGVYDLVLVVQDGSTSGGHFTPFSEAQDFTRFVFDNNLKIGRFTFSQEDLTIPTGGLPLFLVRTYDSSNLRAGDFGYCWSFDINDLDVQLDEFRGDVEDLDSGEWFSMRLGGGRDVTLILPGGERTTFYFDLEPCGCNPGDEADFCLKPVWNAPPGVTAKLEPIMADEKMVVLWQLNWWTSSFQTAPENFEFNGWILTTDDGTKYYIEREDTGEHEFDSGYANGWYVQTYGEPRLTKIELLTGEKILINPGYTDRDGRNRFSIDRIPPGSTTPTSSILLERDVLGRIVAAYDPSSLTEGVPSGPPAVRYEYDNNTNLVRVIRLVQKDSSGAGNHIYEITRFKYERPGFPHYITEIVDPRGISPVISEYDESGRLSATIDSKGRRTEFIQESAPPVGGFKSPMAVGRHITREEPLATDRTQYTDTINEYDACGNVVASYQTSHPSGPSSPVVLRAFTTAEDVGELPNLLKEQKIVLDPGADPRIQLTTHAYTYSGDQIASDTVTEYRIRRESDPPADPAQIYVTATHYSGGKLTASVDAKGYVTANEYYPDEYPEHPTWQGQLHYIKHYVSWSDYQGAKATEIVLAENAYDATGRLEWSKDAIKHRTSYTYHSGSTPDGRAGDVASVENYEYVGPDNYRLLARTEYTYDEMGNRKTETQYRDRSSNPSAAPIITQYQYDAQGRLTKTIDPLNGVSESVYEAGFLFLTRDRYGAETWNTYNPVGDLVQVQTPDEAISRTATLYDSSGQRQVIHERPHFAGDPVFGTRTTYDKLGRPVTTEQLENLVIDLEPRGAAYEAVYRSSTVIAGSVAQTHYDDAGRMDYTIDAKNYRTDYGYDVHNRRDKIINVVDTKSIALTSEFDPNGNKESFYVMVNGDAPPANRRTDYEYDRFNRQFLVTLPSVDGSAPRNTRQSNYDLLGNRIEEIDQEGVGTAYGYDGLGRLIAVTNVYRMTGYTPPAVPPDQTVTRYKYDDLGRVTEQLDANQSVVTPPANQKPTRYEYDHLGRRTRRTLPEGQYETFVYDPLVGDQILRQTTRNDFNAAAPKSTVLEYDAMGRLLQKTPDASFGVAPIVFTYTATGQRATMADALGTTTYDYDNRDRLWKKETPLGTITYARDDNGNVTSIQSSNPNGSSTTYDWDVLNRLDDVNPGVSGSEVGYAYDDNGNLESFTYPNNVSTVYNYDYANRLTDMSVLAIGGVNPTLAMFNYNPADRLLGKAGQRRAAVESIKTINDVTRVNRRVDYDHDPLYRLTRETLVSGEHTGNIAYDGASGYGDSTGYDRAGNRRKRTVDAALETGLGGKLPTRTWQYNANDWLTGGINAFDANGNTLRGELTPGLPADDQAIDDEFNFENRLARRSTANRTFEIVYDGDGNRAKKIVKDSGGAVLNVVFYLVDSANPSGYAQVLEEFEATTVVPPPEGSRQILRKYTYGHDLLYQERLAGGWQRNYYGYDGHGNVRFLLGQGADGPATILDTYTYDAFGTLIEEWHLAAATPNNYLYCGEQWDADLGMYFLRARYLNTDSGRFWTMDSYEGDNSDPLSLHKYLYCHANPVNGSDPSGHWSLTELMVTGVQIARMGAQVGIRVYVAYDRATWVRDGLIMIGKLSTTGCIDPLALSMWASDFIPFGKVFKQVKIVGKKLTGAAPTLQRTFELLQGARTQVSKQLGEIGAASVARVMKLKPTNFPVKYHGIDDVYQKGEKLIIVEAKGGSAELAKTQMSKNWIDYKIVQLHKRGIDGEADAAVWGKKLQQARDSGNLQGMVVKTRLDGDTVLDPEFELKDYAQIGQNAY